MSAIGPHIKLKIGSHLSYPVKFVELSESLSPLVDQLGVEVWFWNSKPPLQNETRESYPLVEVSYSPDKEPPWRLTIAPVPRSLRSRAHPLLLSILSGRVRSWLLAERAPGWYSTHHALRIQFAIGTWEPVFHEHNAV